MSPCLNILNKCMFCWRVEHVWIHVFVEGVQMCLSTLSNKIIPIQMKCWALLQQVQTQTYSNFLNTQERALSKHVQVWCSSNTSKTNLQMFATQTSQMLNSCWTHRHWSTYGLYIGKTLWSCIFSKLVDSIQYWIILKQVQTLLNLCSKSSIHLNKCSNIHKCLTMFPSSWHAQQMLSLMRHPDNQHVNGFQVYHQSS